MQYMIKSFNYKSECTYMMVDIIKYLDKYFNLFAFEDNMVIKPLSTSNHDYSVTITGDKALVHGSLILTEDGAETVIYEGYVNDLLSYYETESRNI